MNFTRKVLFEKDKPISDFAAARNKLLHEAKGDWVLFLDTDEKLSLELEKEIMSTIDDAKYDGYYIKRKDYFLGKWLRFGETGNIKLLRLGRKGVGRWRRRVHEFWDIKNAGQLKNPILHHPKWSIKKINAYSDIDAKEFGPFSYRDLLKPAGKFFVNYILKFGFLDGLPGFIHAYLMSFQSLVVRVKQYDLTETS